MGGTDLMNGDVEVVMWVDNKKKVQMMRRLKEKFMNFRQGSLI